MRISVLHQRLIHSLRRTGLVVWIFLACEFNSPLVGQTMDSSLFSFDAFRSIVLQNHPVIKQSDLRVQAGQSTLRSARGAFDPKLEARFDNKFYKGTNYYDLTTARLKIPTIAAAELNAGFDLNGGTYLNPEELTPDDGLFYAGISLPLLQGLVIDERRATLRQARAFREYSKAERDVIINDLLQSAYNQYWDWWSAAEKVRIVREMADLAVQRKTAVKNRALAGDRPNIDTLEAHLQVQLRLQQLQEMKVNEVKSRLTLSTYLWKDEGENEDPLPLLIDSESVPQGALIGRNFPGDADTLLINFSERIAQLSTTHPIARQYRYKLESLVAEERWKREKIKPKLNINYNILSLPTTNSSGEESTSFSTNNYKWGIDFSFPLLMRESRGQLELQQIKIRETELEREQKMNALANKARAALSNLELMIRQYDIAQNNLANYEALLTAERTRFFNGESSLFLINQREIAFVDARNKVVEIAQKIKATENELLWALGVIK